LVELRGASNAEAHRTTARSAEDNLSSRNAHQFLDPTGNWGCDAGSFKLGPGVLESSYEACLKYELQRRGLNVISQVGLPLIYDEVRLELGYRLDLLVENEINVEIKAANRSYPFTNPSSCLICV
jgi:hypothetical protein